MISTRFRIPQDCHALDVNQLHRSGVLAAGAIHAWRWEYEHEPAVEIGIVAYTDSILLVYTVTDRDGHREEVQDDVELTKTACNYGGHRPWFRCPDCNRRVGKLFLRDGRFRCRHCHDLAYQSQLERRAYRLLRKRDKIAFRLGGKPAARCPPRPRGMHARTYRVLRDRFREADVESLFAAVRELRLRE